MDERGPLNCNLWPDGMAPYDRRLDSISFLDSVRGRHMPHRETLITVHRRYGAYRHAHNRHDQET